MEIKIAEIDGVKVFRPIGNLDRDTAPEFEKLISEQFTPQCHVVIDLSEVELVSSAGLRVMFILAKQVDDPSGFVLAGASDYVEDILRVTGFAGLLKVEKTVAGAVSAIKASK